MLPDNRPAILVVDESLHVRKMMYQVLTGRGYTVWEAASGECGLEQFELHHGNLALAVIEMLLPGMTGLDLAAELERRHPGFPILYTSALGESIAVESIARRSPERVLLKPFTATAFRTRVRQLLKTATPRRAMRAG